KKTEKVSTIKNEVEPYLELKDQVFRAVIEKLENEDISNEDLKNSQVFANKIESVVNEVLSSSNEFVVRKDKQKLIFDIMNEIMGYGPIQPLIDDESVSEIMVNGPKMVYVERKGKLILSEAKFKDDDHVLRIIEKIVAPLG